MVSTLSRISKRPNLNRTKKLTSNCDKDLTRKKVLFPNDYTLFRKCQQGKDKKEYLYFYLSCPTKTRFLSKWHTNKRCKCQSITFDHLLNPQKKKKTFDYLTKEGMGIILHFISFLLFNNHFQTSSVEDLRSSINIWWSLYWGKLLNPLEHKSLFRYT